MAATFSIKSLSHHAYCLIGGESVRDQLVSIVNVEHEIAITGNPDFFEQRYETFTIEDARKLKSLHEMRPTTNDGKKVFIITVDNITSEAQNALLKLLEEPAEYAHFFLIIPSAHLLLPTVKSRLSFVEMHRVDGDMKKGSAVSPDEEVINVSKIFVTSTPAKRLEMVKKLVDDISKEKRSKQSAIDFLDAIQTVVYKDKGVKNGKATLEVIETARKYVSDRSPSLKMLLEYVALNL